MRKKDNGVHRENIMESFSTAIVVFTIFAALFWIAALAFVALDKNAKEHRWIWLVATLLIGPISVLPYWFWGRERK